MKISFDANPLMSHGSILWAEGYSTPANTHWRAGLDNGTVEGGSSGSPLFNTNKRVIGQLHGGVDYGCPPNLEMYYGRFDVSWTGGGSSDTRLSDWLGNAASLHSLFIISGPESIPCSGSVTYSLPPGISATGITWTVSSNLQINNGQGTSSISVSKKSSSSSVANAGTVSVTVSGGSSGNKKVIVGTSLTSIGGPGTTGTGISTYYSPVTYNPGSTYQWLVYPSSGVSTSYGSQGSCILYFSQPGSYTVVCREVTACSTGEYILKDIQVGSSYAMSYRIASSLSGQIVIMPEAGRNDLLGATKMLTYRLSNMITGVSVATGRMPASGAMLDFSHLPAGIYVLRIETGVDTFDTHKVVLK